MQPLLLTWRFLALTLWGVGVQVHEAVGTVGLAALVASFLPEVTKLRRTHLVAWWPVLAFILWSLVAPSLGGRPPDGTGLARTLDWLALPFAAAALAQLPPERLARLAGAVAVTLLVSCVVAGLQHFGLWPPESAFAGLEFLRIPFGRVYEPIQEGATRYMGGGLLFHRLKFSHVSGLALVLVVTLAARAAGRARVQLGALATFGLFAVWLFPYARMGAVAATVGVMVVLMHAAPSRRAAALGAGALGVVAVLAVALVTPLRERFVAGLTDAGSGQRTQHLAAGLEAIKQHPWVGVGPGQFRPAKFASAEMAEHVKDNPGKAHNQLVSMAAETGVPGAAFFVALLVWLGWRARKAGALAPVTLGALAQFAVLSVVHDPLFQAPYSMAVVLALAAGLSGVPRSPAATPSGGASA